MDIRKIIAAVLMICFVVSSPVIADTKYVNSMEGLRVRDKPTTDGEILSVIPFGAAVQLLDDEDYGGWYLIDYGKEEAYISGEYTQDTNPMADMTHMGKWRITAYAYTGSPCANGNFPQVDYTIACNSLPFGTVVYISGVGFRTVEDRGPQSMGSEWLDIYMGDVNQCIQWGDQYRDVYVVEE
ncbi:MAG: SH3 domain-containing protein [Lachnospiraceae bacterium]|nr:SH3 domain-containing protein [Lachnospiraceae bacterium]